MAATPEAVAREWFAQVWDAGSEGTIHRLLAPDAQMHGLGGKPIVGPAEFVPYWRNLRAAFPDIRISVERVVAAGDMVAVHCHVTGNHLGDGLGIKATRKPIDTWGMGMARVRDGRIVEAWNSFDFLTLYQQVGLVPAIA